MKKKIVKKRAKKHDCVCDNQGLCHYCGEVMNLDKYEEYFGKGYKKSKKEVK